MRDFVLREPAALIYCPFRRAPAPSNLGRSPPCIRARRGYGGFAHEPFSEDSREYVFVVRRRHSVHH
jgi:hypothetical protein